MDRSERAATVSRPDYSEYWERGLTWSHFLEDEVEKNVELWKGVYDTHRTPEWAIERVEALGGDWKLLTIAEDWCGDASNTVPVVVRFVEAASNLDLRILKRDENPELMDSYLTDGSRSIPVVIVLDAGRRVPPSSRSGWSERSAPGSGRRRRSIAIPGAGTPGTKENRPCGS
jgi:hypothetical protein